MSMLSELAAAIEDDTLHLERPRVYQRDISAAQRMLSACLGLFITSLVVTPFDVVRIRMQQQEVIQHLQCCDPKGVFWQDPGNCHQQCLRITSTSQGMAVIARNEGVRTLWRGLSLTLFMAVPSNIIYFTGYEYIRALLPIRNDVVDPLACGMLARTLLAAVVAPIELVKTRLQLIPAAGQGGVLRNLVADTRAVVRQRGWGTLFTGFQITLWRDVPFSGIYWLCYELFKARLGGAMGVDFGAHAARQDDWKVFCTSFLSGLAAGVIAAFFTNPFDVGKTRLQIADGQLRPRMFPFLWGIYTKEGAAALYGGFAPRVMKIAPLCAIMISSYEIGKKIFKDATL